MYGKFSLIKLFDVLKVEKVEEHLESNPFSGPQALKMRSTALFVSRPVFALSPGLKVTQTKGN